MIVWFVVALAAEPLPSPDVTVDLAEEAELLFRRGVEAYRARRYQDALQYLLASHRIVPNAVVVFDLARTHEELGQLEQAWRYYTGYLAIGDEPELREEAELALGRLTPKVARVSIRTDPPGASVYLDGRDLGRRGVSPLVLALPAGEHHLVLEREGHALAELDTRAVVGQLTEVEVTLRADPVPQSADATAAVRGEGELIAWVVADRCELLGVASPRLPLPLALSDLQGSAFASQTPAAHMLSLELSAEEGGQSRTIRRVLPAVERRSLVLVDPSPLQQVLFERCAPSDADALASALSELRPPARALAVQLFAEWAAWRGATSVPDAASACADRGKCEGLAGKLVGS